MINPRLITRLVTRSGGGRDRLNLNLRSTSTSVNLEVEKVVPKDHTEIPGPRVYPFLGSIPGMMKYKEFSEQKVHEVFYNLVEDFGPIVKLKMPNWPLGVIITSPEDKETVVRATKDNPLRPALTSLKKVRDLTIDAFFERNAGLLAEDGEAWWRVRRGAQTPMMRHKNVEAYLSEMDAVSLQFMDRMGYFQKEFGEMPENFVDEIYKWAFESVSVVALSRRLGCLDPDLPEDSEQVKIINIVGDLFKTLNDCEFTGPLWKIYPTPTFKKLQRMHQELLEIALANISDTENALKEALEKEGSVGRELTLMEQLLLRPELDRKDVVTMILDMIFAGIDTTSHTLAFAMYLLAKNPEAQKKMHEEVDRVLKGGGGPLTPSDVAKLSYTKAVVKETLRLFPVATGFLRVLSSDVVLSGYHVPKGQSALCLNYERKKDTSSFQRSDEFLPERFLRGNALATSHPFASLPFGAGTRMCIGRRIAEQEMYTFLARLMQRFSVAYNYGEMDCTMQLVLKPNKPLKFTLTERNA